MSFLNKTIKEGIFFLVPMLLVYLLIAKLYSLLTPLAENISRKLFNYHFLGIKPVYIIAILLILIVCFLIGLLALTSLGKIMLKSVEDNLLVILPGYKLIKSTSQSIVGLEDSANFPVVLAPIDGWMIAFVVEKLETGESVVFVPGSPNPWSGNVIIFTDDQLRPTSLKQKDAIRILRQTGMSFKSLKGDC